MATTIKKQKSATPQENKGTMRAQEFLYLCLANWQWFVVSIVVCMTLAYIYIKVTPPTYSRSAEIAIKTDTRGRIVSQNAAMFEDLGLYNGNTYIFDEVALIKSPDLMRDVVRRLNLDMTYTVEGRFRDIDLYGSTLPVQVSLPDMPETRSAFFKLKLGKNGEYTISDIVLDGRQMNRQPIQGRIGIPMPSPLGQINVTPGKSYNPDSTIEINVSKVPVKDMAKALSGALTAASTEESECIVNIGITNTHPERAEDIVREIIAVYNDRWIQDKRNLADNSSKFIDERVQLLQSELGSVDSDISAYKSANLVPDVSAAASIYMSQASQASMELKDLRNQEYMAKYIRNYLRNTENSNKLLPANTGLTSGSIANQIALYNTKILERNSLISQSSASNPLVTEMDQAIAAMRGALVASIDNEILSLSEQIRSQEGFTGSANSKIASNPKQAKYLLSVERQQKVKETLYLYLLQKREENQLNQAFTSYNTRMIREVDGPGGPIAPVTGNIYLLAFVSSLVIPALILFVRECSVHVVRGRKDVKDMHIPFAGELPLHSKRQKLSKASFKPKESKPVVAVKENSRNSINEAFRVVRTNVEFMFGADGVPKVVMLTSANPNSGKTFVTYNLAKSFAIKNKRVICVDLDMRKASLSKYITGTGYGISDYLANRTNDIDSIIQKCDDCPNLSMIPVGTIPPNPTELLFSERLHALFEDLKRHYDYIFVDCPPVEVVADASIISKFADHTLFVIRAGLMDLSMLPVVDELYENNTYPSMSLILNGTVNPKNRYSRHYGNPYSYGYGYGRGYHYSNDD